VSRHRSETSPIEPLPVGMDIPGTWAASFSLDYM